MHIIHITHGYSFHTGGVQRVTKELTMRLAQKGYTVEVYTPGPRDRKDAAHENLHVHYLPSLEIAHTPFMPTLLWHLLRAPKNSIFHVHVAKAFLPEIVYFISKLKGIRYIAHFHLDVDPTGIMGFILPLYKRLVLKRVLQDAETVVALSDEQSAWLTSTYELNGTTMTIPNGTSNEFYVENKEFSTDIFNVLFVGRLSPQKNVRVLVQAAALLKSQVIVHIVGEGEQKEDLQKLIHEQHIQNVVLHGAKYDNELHTFYQNADVFVLPSIKEGLPEVLVEAMASALPIVASDVIGNREFVADTGILVNPPTPENFAYEIDCLLSNPTLLKKMSRHSQVKARRHNWDTIVHEFINLYEKTHTSH